MSIETRITSEQGKDAVYQAHLSKSAIEKIEGMNSSASEIDTNTLKTFNKVVKEFHSNPLNNVFSTTINAFANAYPYSGEVFNAVKLFVNVEKKCNIKVAIFLPSELSKEWYNRTAVVNKTITVTPSDSYITVDFEQTLSIANLTESHFYIAIRTEDATGVRLALNNCIINSSTNYLIPKYSVIGTQATTVDAKFRWYDVAVPDVTPYLFWFQLLYLNYNGINKEYIEQVAKEQTIINESEKLEVCNYLIYYNLQGLESNIYYKNMQYNDTDYNVNIKTDKSIGRTQKERWNNPKTTILTNIYYSMSLEWQNKYLNNIASNRIKIQNILPTAGAGVTANVLCIGDSTTEAGLYTQRMLDIAATDSMKISLIGKVGNGLNKFEGYGGKTANWYLTDAAYSPFLFSGVFNFAQYLSSNSFATPNIVSIHLGINDILSMYTLEESKTKLQNAVNNMTTLIANIKASIPTVKFIINTCIVPASQDAFGVNYTTQLSKNIYKTNLQKYNSLLISTFRDRESEGIYLNCNMTLNIDTEIGFDSIDELISEHSTVTKKRYNNAVHPNSAGYKMMGDSLWSCLKYIYRP